MLIQLNTDHNIHGSENLGISVNETITDALAKYVERITRVEVHFVDENAGKPGPADKRCTLEARMAGAEPIAVTNHADNLTIALDGAIDKLKAVLDTKLGKERNH